VSSRHCSQLRSRTGNARGVREAGKDGASVAKTFFGRRRFLGEAGVSELEGETFRTKIGMLNMHSDANIIERNKATIRNLFSDVINTGRLDLCEGYLAADRVDHQDYGLPVGAADGHDGFKRVLGFFRDAFPDLTLTIDFIVADDEKLVANVTTSGTHFGNFLGAPPTGKRFEAQGADIFAFNEAGLVSDHWGAFDALGMMRQLGLLPTLELQQAA
jgi:predicted ester cyclase